MLTEVKTRHAGLMKFIGLRILLIHGRQVRNNGRSSYRTTDENKKKVKNLKFTIKKCSVRFAYTIEAGVGNARLANQYGRPRLIHRVPRGPKGSLPRLSCPRTIDGCAWIERNPTRSASRYSTVAYYSSMLKLDCWSAVETTDFFYFSAFTERTINPKLRDSRRKTTKTKIQYTCKDYRDYTVWSVYVGRQHTKALLD
jgi:hypothetical protein